MRGSPGDDTMVNEGTRSQPEMPNSPARAAPAPVDAGEFESVDAQGAAVRRAKAASGTVSPIGYPEPFRYSVQPAAERV